MTISAGTKISALLRENPEALEAIVSLSPKFTKLRNPLLRKLMASRTTIGMASKIGGCTPEDFFAKLAPLGFTVDGSKGAETEETQTPRPAFMEHLDPANVQELDVRPILSSGQDPFNLILGKVKALHTGEALRITNDFEPIPLIQLLGKQGFRTYSELLDSNTWHTWFFKAEESAIPTAKAATTSDDFDAWVGKFESRTKTIDVRHLEMPLPMLTILDELEHLPDGHALYVNHKRIPVFLLPELEERRFEYRVKEIGEGDVKMFIFKA
ncbi:MAG: DUF2249 domain-containing protein [Bacteroidetes bacterium]|nr:DUF2249 domain-containing protein [Bacteroidota bacterium]MBS1939789.1 DUF2249 domain-containing protein [Bacteroidota bacterium]